MSIKKDGRQMLTVGKGTAAVLSGEDDLSTWSDEELAYGRRKDRNGHWTGHRSRWFPSIAFER